jgi:hypothetical protein
MAGQRGLMRMCLRERRASVVAKVSGVQFLKFKNSWRADTENIRKEPNFVEADA